MPASRRRKKKSTGSSSRKLASKQVAQKFTFADAISGSDIINRGIVFASDYYRSGVKILSYFSEILRQKGSDINARIRIEQVDLTLRMYIELSTGEIEIIEAKLDNYDSLTIEEERLESLNYLDNFWRADSSEAIVIINLPQKSINPFTIERIQSAVNNFMHALGFKLDTQDDPIYGSFFQRLKFLWDGQVKEEVSEVYNKGKVALEAQFIDLPSAEITAKLATSAAELITAIAPVNDAAIRCGSLLIIKVTKDGIAKVVIETVSPELAAFLNKNPALLETPSIVFNLLSSMRVSDKSIEQGTATAE